MPSDASSPASLERLGSMLRELQAEVARLAAVAPHPTLPGGAGAVLLEVVALATRFLEPEATPSEDELLRETLAGLARLMGAQAAWLVFERPGQADAEICHDPLEAGPGFEQAARSLAEQARCRRITLGATELSGELSLDEAGSWAEIGPLVAVPLLDAAAPADPEAPPAGVLCLARLSGEPEWEPDELLVARTVGSFALRALPAYRRLRDHWYHELRLSLLNRLYESLSRNLELDDVLGRVVEVTREVTGAERAFVLLRAHDQLLFGAGLGEDGALGQQDSRDLSRTVCQRVLATGEGVHVYDMAQAPDLARRPSAVKLHITSVAAVPLVGPGGVTGVLYVDARQRLMPELARAREALEAVARVASLAVESARLYQQVTVDAVTGLYARSFFMHRLEEALRRTQAGLPGFALLVLDIDRFKHVNDTHGHQAGDEVLRVVAARVRAAVRMGVDLVGRFGGDEMMLLLPETDAAGAEWVAERIRAAVAGAPIPIAPALTVDATVSIGLTTHPLGGATSSELFASADEALYLAKAAGRNCVRRHPEGG